MKGKLPLVVGLGILGLILYHENQSQKARALASEESAFQANERARIAEERAAKAEQQTEIAEKKFRESEAKLADKKPSTLRKTDIPKS